MVLFSFLGSATLMLSESVKVGDDRGHSVAVIDNGSLVSELQHLLAHSPLCLLQDLLRHVLGENGSHVAFLCKETIVSQKGLQHRI